MQDGDLQTRILVVTDVPHRERELSLLLRDSGFEILNANTGGDGLAIAGRARPDLIVAEFAWPDTDGVEFCRGVRADRRLEATPLLLAGTGDGGAAGFLEAGANDALQAPYASALLVARAVRLVERRRANAERAHLLERERGATEAAEAAEERFRLLADMMPQFMWTTEPDGNSDYYN